MITIEKLSEILSSNNLNGFSVAVKWELKRYVVANTHNDFIELDLVNKTKLVKQANENFYVFDNVTIGGWIDSKTGILYIDAGMSTDDLDYAINVGNYNKQIAIWDNVEWKEIIL